MPKNLDEVARPVDIGPGKGTVKPLDLVHKRQLSIIIGAAVARRLDDEIRFFHWRRSTRLCTENLNPHVTVMKATKDWA